jgi:hypothetical protein
MDLKISVITIAMLTVHELPKSYAAFFGAAFCAFCRRTRKITAPMTTTTSAAVTIAANRHPHPNASQQNDVTIPGTTIM